MGIYDRDYYRGQQRPGMVLRGPSTAIGWLIAINVAIFILDGLVGPPKNGAISHALSLNTGVLTQPWLWWKFLTCGFAHASYPYYQHVLFNMLGLFFLGRIVEQRYGRKEFLWFYMVTIVLGSVSWCVLNSINGLAADVSLVGASGAITGVVMLFALNFPKQTILLFFVIPMPAWVLGVMIVLFNLFGTAGAGGEQGGPQIAYGVHLAGAGFALAYYQFRWNISRLVDRWIPKDLFKNRPKLRVHDPSNDYASNDGPSRAELRQQAKDKGNEKEVDRILAKIHNEGEDSLTRKERRTMESASRRLRDRGRGE